MSDNGKSKTSKIAKPHRKKHHTVRPYIVTPIIYVLIAMIVIVPVSIGLMNTAVNLVHRAQKTFTMDYCDVQVEDVKFVPGDAQTGQVKLPEINAYQQYGIIECIDAGLKADVYYGLNRINLRKGAASSSQSAIPGQGDTINVAGYNKTAFKSLKYVEKGDEITFTTNYGVYRYQVYSVTKSNSYKSIDVEDGETLVLSCDYSDGPFSNQSDERLYVCCNSVSRGAAE